MTAETTKARLLLADGELYVLFAPKSTGTEIVPRVTLAAYLNALEDAAEALDWTTKSLDGLNTDGFYDEAIADNLARLARLRELRGENGNAPPE